MKKKKALLLLLLCLATLALRAQDAATCYIHMPDSLSPLLTPVNRADFIDFLQSQMRARVTNTLDGKSEMTLLTSDYLKVQTTPRSTFQLKLLPLCDSLVICTVTTVCGPACDSQIRFYTPAWQPLSGTDYLPAPPSLSRFLPSEPDSISPYTYQTAVQSADLLLLKADLSGTDTSLTFTFDTPRYLSTSDSLTLAPFLVPSVRYVWTGQKFQEE